MLATHSLVEYRLAVSKGQGSFGLRIGHTPGRPTTVLGFSIVAADEGGDAAGRGPVERLGIVHIGDVLAGIDGMCVNTDHSFAQVVQWLRGHSGHCVLHFRSSRTAAEKAVLPNGAGVLSEYGMPYDLE